MHTAIVTAYVGPDEAGALVPARPPGHLGAFAFTTADTPTFESAAAAAGWTVLQLPDAQQPPDRHPATVSKLPKVCPSTFDELAPYDFVVWTDNKYNINVEAVEAAIAAWPPAAAVMFPRHPYLAAGARAEVAEAVRFARYAPHAALMCAYVEAQEAAGLVSIASEACPHYASGFIVWNMRHADVARIQQTWWDAILRVGGLECQVPQFYLSQQFPGAVVPFPGPMAFGPTCTWTSRAGRNGEAGTLLVQPAYGGDL